MDVSNMINRINIPILPEHVNRGKYRLKNVITYWWNVEKCRILT